MRDFLQSVASIMSERSGFPETACFYAILACSFIAVTAVQWSLFFTVLSVLDEEPMSFEEALSPGMPRLICWAGRWFPEAWERFHFAISGTTRVGKSILLSLYVKSILPRIGSDCRLVIYDPKNELHVSLFADSPVEVHYTLPTDERSSCWDLAKDITSPGAAFQFAEAIVPPSPGDQNDWFASAVRELVVAVITSLNITHPGAWDLGDVVRILEDCDLMAHVIRRAGPQSTLRLMDEERTWGSIQATLATHLNSLRIIAAMWSRAGRHNAFSITDFVNGSEGIIVLGRDPRFSALLDRLNALFLTQLFSHLLAQADSVTRRTYLVIDELAVAAGEGRPLPGFKDICERGASRGVVIAVAYHSYAAMKQLYKEDADAILAMLQNRVFLRAEDTPTAQFSSALFGKKRDWIKTVSVTTSEGNGYPTRTVSDHYHEEDVVPYEKFFELTPASPEHGITGYWLSPPPARSSTPFLLTGDWIDENMPRRSDDVEAYLMRPDSHQYLTPLGFNDIRRLKLPLPDEEDEAEGQGRSPQAFGRPRAPARGAAGDGPLGRLRRLVGGGGSNGSTR